jgi:hypothetical protein
MKVEPFRVLVRTIILANSELLVIPMESLSTFLSDLETIIDGAIEVLSQ